MQAVLKLEQGVSIIEIKGQLEMEKSQSLKQICVEKFTDQKIVFNLSDINFVGSTGVQTFLETLVHIGQKNTFGLKVVSPRPEFKRILQNLDLDALQIFESEANAIESFNRALPTSGSIQS